MRSTTASRVTPDAGCRGCQIPGGAARGEQGEGGGLSLYRSGRPQRSFSSLYVKVSSQQQKPGAKCH